MKYISAFERQPEPDVDVYVVTLRGTHGIAKYWDTTGHWMTQDENLKPDDVVKKWRYASAT